MPVDQGPGDAHGQSAKDGGNGGEQGNGIDAKA